MISPPERCNAKCSSESHAVESAFSHASWYTSPQMPKAAAFALKRKSVKIPPETAIADLSSFVPLDLRDSGDGQTMIPRLAKDDQAVQLIEQAVQTVPTKHQLFLGDSRKMSGLKPESLHLVLTSPPYWTLKEYRSTDSQLGHVEDYEQFLRELDKVWKQCFDALFPAAA